MNKEISILRQIKSLHVVKFFGYKVDKNGDHLILMEFCNGGSLDWFIKIRGGKLDEKEAHYILKQLVRGIKA